MAPDNLLLSGTALCKKGLCDSCLGRQFGKMGHGLLNIERGRALRHLIAMENGTDISEVIAPSDCKLCEGLVSEKEHLCSIACEELGKIEYDTFLVGTKVEQEIIANEESLRTELGLASHESIKSEMNREIGKRIEQKTGKHVEFKSPNVVAIIDTRFDVIKLDIAPVFLYGRYRKYSREIPQTRWYCKKCLGKGCERCNQTGKMYQTSIEELISAPLIELTKAPDAFLHGMGREDIDAVMIGNGRPFILELSRPVARAIDFEKMQNEINKKAGGKVEITGLCKAGRSDIERVKTQRCDKSYEATVEFGSSVDEKKLVKVLSELAGKTINQVTPSRVLHRRANLNRVRGVRDVGLLSIVDGKTARIRLKVEAGTYVKELVSGDDGRTQPSIAGLLDVEARVRELDVIRIHDGGMANG